MNTCLKWHGGKSYLAKRIVEMMPPHTRYCEPFFGGGAVLFARDGEGVAEYVNDIDNHLTNFWRVLSNTNRFERFQRIIEAVPFSEVEFDESRMTWIPIVDDIEEQRDLNAVSHAASFFIRNRQSRQGLCKSFATPTTRTRRGMNENVSAWITAVDGLPEFHARLRRVEICCQDAISFINKFDFEQAFFYADPPYLHETRTVKDAYRHEMTDVDHIELLRRLANIKGKFLLSGYPNELYEDWAVANGVNHIDIEIDNKASGSKTKEKKIERLWFNYELPCVMDA